MFPKSSALALLAKYPTLLRHPGGFWAGPDWREGGDYAEAETIKALVAAGQAEYCGWRKDGEWKFAIEVRAKG